MTYFAFPSMLACFLVPIGLGIAALYTAHWRKNVTALSGQPETIIRLFPPGLMRRRRWIIALQLMGLVCWVIALAGPLLGSRLVEFKQKGLDVFIAVDCSLSMQAEDLKPNRMAHAKLLLGQLIDRLAGDRIGIIAFAGQAYVQCPLTIDGTAAREALDAIDVGTVPIPGTVIGDAIRVALKGLKAGEGGGRVLILLTDGEDHHSDPLGAANEASRLGVKVYAIGIGSAQGEPIPVFDEQGNRTGYKRDKKGDVVMSRVDDATLQKIAETTGGQYLRASLTGSEAESLAQTLDGLKHGDQKTRLFNRLENRYQWPLALGLLLILLSLAIPEGGWRSL